MSEANGMWQAADGRWYPMEWHPEVRPLAARERREKAVRQFGIGVGVGVLASLISLGSNGGVIWTGGLLVAAIMLWRSLGNYRMSLKLGAPRPGSQAIVSVSAALVLTLALAGAVGYQATIAEPSTFAGNGGSSQANTIGPDDTGSCWAVEGGTQIRFVSCADASAALKATRDVSDPMSCPDIYTEGDPGHYLCLTPLP